MAETGDVIAGRYEIVRQLGAGGMGAVYQARQISMDRMVALKLIHPHIASRPEVAARFHREMQATSRIEHPNTIQVYDYGATEGGQLFLAMEFIEGRSLSKVVDEDGPLPGKRILHVAKQIVRALGAAHEEAIAHRDLKPDNVMIVDRYGEHDIVKVLDFGIARFVDGGEVNPQMTAEGALLGTPAYMSPEQAMGRPVDHRTDFYSLGVMLYQLGVGKLPFDAPTLAGFLVAHATEQPPPPSQVAPGRVSAPLEALILQLLAKTPEERPANASELLTRLETCEQATVDDAVTEAAAGFVPRAHKQDLASPPPRPARWGWLALGVLVAIVPAALVAVRHSRARAALRSQLDTLLLAHGDPLAPEICRVRDRALLTRMVAAAEGLRDSVVGQPRPGDRQALASLHPEGTDDTAPAELWALIARARLVVDVDPTAALAAAQRATTCEGYALAHDLVGAAEQRARRIEAAKAAYHRAIELAPDYLAPRFNLGLLALREHDAGAAAAACDEVLRRNPGFPGANLVRGQARLLLGDLSGATRDLETATEREPSAPEGWLLLGSARGRAGATDAAKEAFCKAKALGSEEAKRFCP